MPKSCRLKEINQDTCNEPNDDSNEDAIKCMNGLTHRTDRQMCRIIHEMHT